MKINIVFIFYSIVLLIGCSSGITKESTHEPAAAVGTGHQSSVKSDKYVKTIIKANSTAIEAVVDSVQFIDEYQYRLFAVIDSVIPESSQEPLIESHQKVELTPKYFLYESGKIDMNDERNKKILQLRSSLRGDSFSGKITLLPQIGWVITSVQDMITNH
jgi:hypothetical protein